MKTAVFLLIVLAIMAGAILLQIFPSQKDGKWFGLILPGVAFAHSLLLSLFSFVPAGDMTWWGIIGSTAAVLLMANIPPLILLAIYFGCREQIRRKKALEKMSIQDLE